MAKGNHSYIASQLTDQDQNEIKYLNDLQPQNAKEDFITQPNDKYIVNSSNGKGVQEEGTRVAEEECRSDGVGVSPATISLISDKSDVDVRNVQDPQKNSIKLEPNIADRHNGNIVREVLTSDNTTDEQHTRHKQENNGIPRTPQVDAGRSKNTVCYFILVLCVAVMILKKSFMEPILIIVTILAEPYFCYANLSLDNSVTFESKYNDEEIQEQCIEQETENNIEETVLSNDFNEPQASHDMVLELPPSGKTLINWLSEEDLYKLKDLALIKLHTIFKCYDIDSKSKIHRKKKSLGGFEGVFKVDLEHLHEQDKQINIQSENIMNYENKNFSHRISERKVPLVICKLIAHLEQHGLHEEGILRKAGNSATIKQLLAILDQHFYSNPTLVDEALANASAHDVASVFKTLIRDLPFPLLTEMHMAAFYKTHKVPNLHERLLALTMLILQLPPTHRDTLYMILELCSAVASNEPNNKMSLTNVSTIMAPNLFQPQKSHTRIRRLSLSADKHQAITDEMVWTNETPNLMGILIKYRELIWTVPHQLISQLRTEYNSEANKQKNYMSNLQFRQLIWRKSRVESIRESSVEANNEDMEFLNITMPQFNEAEYKINLSADTTVKEVLVKVLRSENVDDAVKMSIPLALESHRNPLNHFTNTAGEATTNVTTSRASNSLLTNTANTLQLCTRRPSLQNALQHHALHECGGNIGERLLDHPAKVKSIYQENPTATFVVKCHHCNNEDNANDLISNIETCSISNNSSQDDSVTESESVLLHPSNWNSCIQILISLPIYPTACALFVIFATFYSIIWDYREHN